MHLVDQALAKVLLDDACAATKTNILALGRLASPGQGVTREVACDAQRLKQSTTKPLSGSGVRLTELSGHA